MAPPKPPPLARYLLAAYGLLIAYASLHPLTGWRDQGVEPLAFLNAPFPRYFTWFDLLANLLAYLPLGFLVVASLGARSNRLVAIAVGILVGAALSLSMEALQTYLPSRHPSNLDLATNACGATLGAVLGAVLKPRVLGPSGMIGVRERWFLPGGTIDIGLVLIALWWVTQLNPESLLFGNGSLRDMFDAVAGQRYDPEVFVRIEAAISAAQLAVIGLIIGGLVVPGRPVWLITAIALVVALLVRTVAFAVLFTPVNMFSWATRGGLLGVAAGIVLLGALGALPRRVHLATAGLMLVCATVFVNLAPVNPYTAHAIQVWRKGHFLTLSGLTEFVSTVWPFATLAYLWFASGRRRVPMASGEPDDDQKPRSS